MYDIKEHKTHEKKGSSSNCPRRLLNILTLALLAVLLEGRVQLLSKLHTLQAETGHVTSLERCDWLTTEGLVPPLTKVLCMCRHGNFSRSIRIFIPTFIHWFGVHCQMNTLAYPAHCFILYYTVTIIVLNLDRKPNRVHLWLYDTLYL